jgi:hypothetical protein
MQISKPDFKIIFNKIKSNPENINKYIKNLKSNGKTEDEDIDNIITKYNSDYILKVINKINQSILKNKPAKSKDKYKDTLLKLSEALKRKAKILNTKETTLKKKENSFNIPPTNTNTKTNTDTILKENSLNIPPTNTKTNTDTILKENSLNIPPTNTNTKTNTDTILKKISLNIPPTNTETNTDTDTILKKIFG